MGLLKNISASTIAPNLRHEHPTKDTIALHSVRPLLPPLAAWRRAEIDDNELGDAKVRDARAKQRDVEIKRCDSEDRLDVARQHEREDAKMRGLATWSASATGRLFEAIHTDDEDEQPQSMPGRVRAFCPVCQRDHARRWEHEANAKAAWLASMNREERELIQALERAIDLKRDVTATAEKLQAWRAANPSLVAQDLPEVSAPTEPVLVVEHRYGQVLGSEMRLACLNGCAPDAIEREAAALIVDRERAESRKRTEKDRATMRAELTPTAAVAPVWLLPDFVPSGSLTVLNGTTGTMKTWIAEGIALAIATGRPFVGREPRKRGRVLLVLAESYAINLVRIEPLARGMGATLEPDTIGIWPKGVPFKTHEPSTMAKLADYIRTQDFAAIVIDNLTEIRGGTAQNAENDSTVISNALRPLAQLAHDGTIDGVRVTNRPPAIVVLHHDRGSTAIGQHADYVLRLSRGSQAPEAPVSIKLGDGCRLASPGLPITMRFRGIAPDAITPELIARREQAAEPEPTEELTERQRAILLALREQPGQSLRGVHRVVNGSLRDIGPALRALEARGYAELRDGQWYGVDEE